MINILYHNLFNVASGKATFFNKREKPMEKILFAIFGILFLEKIYVLYWNDQDEE